MSSSQIRIQQHISYIYISSLYSRPISHHICTSILTLPSLTSYSYIQVISTQPHSYVRLFMYIPNWQMTPHYNDLPHSRPILTNSVSYPPSKPPVSIPDFLASSFSAPLPSYLDMLGAPSLIRNAKSAEGRMEDSSCNVSLSLCV